MQLRPTPEQITELMEYLLGSCHTLEEGELIAGVHSHDENEQRINERGVFLCESCGWWCEEDEMEDQSICKDCADA